MGRKGNDIRKRLKAEAKRYEALGWYETEYGELKKKVSKTEARRVFLMNCRRARARALQSIVWMIDFDAAAWMPQAEQDIISSMDETVRLEIDAEVLAELSRASPPVAEMSL